MLADRAWHEGVIGIVAGRLREQLGKPACVIALGPDGVGKGSARSIPGFRLGSAIIAAHQAGILLGGGGHDMAAGFSIEERQIGAPCRRFWSREWHRIWPDRRRRWCVR